jgi:hypothetical protein
MSFFCWYSITKNLPDSKVFVAAHRRKMTYDIFNWTRKCNIPLFLHKETDSEGQIQEVLKKVEKPLLVIPPDCFCIRDFDEAGFKLDIFDVQRPNSELLCDCREEKPCVFATYSNGWGKFVTSSWINKMGCPPLDVKYNQGILTVNESRIGKLWDAATPLFQTVSRE